MITKIARELVQGLRARRPIHRGLRILTYHGVVEKFTDLRVERSFHTIADFNAHLSLLRHCRVVGLDELVAELPRGALVPRVAITFDDGFRNNIVAAELLAKHRLPATIFITSDAIAQRTTIWPTLLRLVLARGSRRVIRIEGIEYSLDRDPKAFGNVRTLFKRAETKRRRAMWNELIAQLATGELDDLIAEFPSIAQMSWGEVGSLRASGITFGSHGYEHELHHSEQAADLRRHELRASRDQIEAALGTDCRWFAYPNGTFNDHSSEELKASGYDLGFTMVSRAATSTDNLTLLPRIMPGPGPEKLANAVVFGN